MISLAEQTSSKMENPSQNFTARYQDYAYSQAAAQRGRTMDRGLIYSKLKPKTKLEADSRGLMHISRAAFSRDGKSLFAVTTNFIPQHTQILVCI